MDKIQFRSLLPLVNEKSQMGLLQSYADIRIENLLKQLETEQGLNRIREIQGCVKELRRFKTLRDEVIKGSE